MLNIFRKIATVLMGSVLLCTFAGCSNGVSAGNKTINQNNPKSVAEGFIDCLVNANYSGAKSLLYIQGNSDYFTEKDFAWYVPRSSYAETENFREQKVSLQGKVGTKTADAATCVVTASYDKDKTKEFRVNLKMDNENKWYVFDDSFYIKEFYVVTPGGNTKVMLDGKDITAILNNKNYGTQGLRKIYTVPNIGKSEKKISVVAEKTFGTKEFAVNPTSNSADAPFVCQVAVQDEGVYQRIASLWNNCYKDYVAGKNAGDFIKYVSPSADSNVATVIYSGLSNINGQLSGKRSNFICSNVRPCSDRDYQSYYLTDSIAYIAFNYNMTWQYKLSSFQNTENMQNYAEIVVDLSENECRVYDAKDRFFSWYNQYTNKIK